MAYTDSSRPDSSGPGDPVAKARIHAAAVHARDLLSQGLYAADKQLIPATIVCRAIRILQDAFTSEAKP